MQGQQQIVSVHWQAASEFMMCLAHSVQKERETFLLDHTPGGERIVTLSPDSEEPSTEEKVHLLHLALRQCLGLLHCVIQKEQEEWGELEADYETLKQSVCVRLQHLLHTTKDLLQSWTVEVTPDHQCTEVTE